MTFLPLLQHELRLRSRRVSTFWLRAAVGGIILLSSLPYLLAPRAANTGQSAFSNMTVAAFLLCCASGLMTADAISSERREQTLGLLFLSRVRSFDLLLGKFGAAGLSGLGAVLTLLPLLLVPVLMGGVTGGEAGRKGLALVNTLFFSLSVGLFSSTCSSDWRRTALRTVLVMTLFVGVPCAFTLLTSGPPTVLINPVATVVTATDSFYRNTPRDYWISLGLTHGLSWAFLAAGAIHLRRSWQERGGDGPSEESAMPFARARRTVHSVGDNDPIEWLVRRQSGVIWVATSVEIVAMLLPLAIVASRFNPVLVWSINSVTSAASLIWGSLIVFAASRFFILGHRSGNLEILQTTPVGAEQIIHGQWNALKRALQGPMVLLQVSLLLPFVVWVLRAPYTLTPGTSYELLNLLHSVLWLVMRALGLWFQVVAFVWAGLWFGLKTRSHPATIAWALFLVEALPFLAKWTMVLLASRVWPSRTSFGLTLFFAVQEIVGLATWYVIIQWSKRQLSRAVHAGHGELTSVAQDLVDTLRRIVTDFQRARHWTRAPKG